MGLKAKAKGDSKGETSANNSMLSSLHLIFILNENSSPSLYSLLFLANRATTTTNVFRVIKFP